MGRAGFSTSPWADPSPRSSLSTNILMNVDSSSTLYTNFKWAKCLTDVGTEGSYQDPLQSLTSRTTIPTPSLSSRRGSVSEPLWFRRRRPAIRLRFLRLLQFPPPALGNRPYDTGRRSYGRAEQLTTARRQILLEAQQAHPERFVRGTPQPPVLPPQAWINPPLEKTTLHDAAQAPLAAASIPGVPPFSASRNKILIDVDVDRTDLTSLPTIIEAH